MKLHPFLLCLVLFWAILPPASGQTPEWIWPAGDAAEPPNGEERFLRREFQIEGTPSKARATFSADNHAVLYVNGEQVGQSDEWASPVVVDVTRRLIQGRNLLAVRTWNDGGPAGMMAKLEFTDGRTNRVIVTDGKWTGATARSAGWEKPGFAGNWAGARSLGKLGMAPWGDVIAGRPASGGGAKSATPAGTLTTLEGFEVELLHSSEGSQGSWICLTTDPKGRLIVSPQGNRQPLLRVTLTGEGKVGSIEALDLPLWEAMGLLWAFDSLYVNGQGPKGTGLYRVRDTDADDALDDVQFLAPMRGGGEHGPHGLALGPDGMIYVMNGNHTKIPDNVVLDSPHRGYAEDLLLPRQWDGNGHARGVMAPGGYVARTDSEGKRWELVLAGFRNAYDLAFNEEGELFTYDSDMEWDWGMPWYRPTRINHCVSGAEFGWRSGTGKWPGYYADSLPATVDVGIGCPTGVAFGTGTRFPAKYQRALYVLDWTYGRIIAAHLTPRGASYEATFEDFVKGKPLNVSDMVAGKDGAFYFITGGRGTQSGLYRVSYKGEVGKEDRVVDGQEAGARALRHRLEAFHGKRDPQAVGVAWPHLNSDDRWIRYAARIAIESQPVSEWEGRALSEPAVNGRLTALLALARTGSAEVQDRLLEGLREFWPGRLDESQQLVAVRVAALSFIRMGRPGEDTVRELLGAAEPLYPAASDRLNRELCQALVYLGSSVVVDKTLALIASAATQEERIHYLFHLRTAKAGWTMESRKAYFTWFNRVMENTGHDPVLVQWFKDVDRGYGNGASYGKFIENFRKEAVENLSETERVELAAYISGQSVAARPAPVPRQFVRRWTFAELEPVLGQVSRGRSFQKGAQAFAAAQCAACHRFGNEGGAAGQDLTAISSRYSRRDILESILEPSKVLSDQYQNTTFHLGADEEVTGRIVDEKQGKLEVLVNPLTDFRVEVLVKDIQRREVSKLSPMPEGLADVLTQEEILDLLAYLESGGRTDHASFRE